ncbi:tenascin isoform X2 [Trichomycterus rosablanca]|uniref:tenascin isoform X2 n=1 Tax=Trichomycterus rosablanca TaxID=2290929 RepID=UPI002F358F01
MGVRGLLLACVVMAFLLNSSRAGLVKKMIRHRRESLTPPKPENLTLPNPDQPVVFNHVYNINVPSGSLCSVDLDSPGGAEMKPRSVPSEQHIEHTVDGENQIVFTHRINIPKQACGCDGHIPDLKDLLNRLEMLEAEVSSLREQCTNGAGCCGVQVTGEVTTKPYCNGHGNYSNDVCGCVCEPGWKGPNCSEPECPNYCQDQGRCVDGKCVCFEGFGGEDCATELCGLDCGENGECIDGACICAEGFMGDDCSMTGCLNNCLGRGRCVEGECECIEPWTGFDCSELICPNDCFDRGRCINGTCHCDEGFTGEDCGKATCPDNCTDRGDCVNGQCVCNFGYSGADCSKLTCPNDCSKKGHCSNGRCVCDPGFQGKDCSTLSCPDNCNERGKCVNGGCVCDPGYKGNDCSELSCPNECHNHGRCVNGKCVCEPGFHGEDCSTLSCPDNCNDRGKCVNGGCVCDPGYKGDDCSEISCPNECHNHGRCVNGKCVCYPGFQGEDCSTLSCPDNCNDRGKCVNGACVCDPGYKGDDCSELSCPNECLNHGRCVNGKCVCKQGFAGEDCSVKTCPNDCKDRGECVDGHCVCRAGFTGKDCSELTCPNNCHDRGHCVNGQCVCHKGYTGEHCGEKTCPNNCLDRGYCEDGICVCFEDYSGVDCSELTCPGNCNDQGRCLNGMCICALGFTGDDCSEITPPQDLTVTEVTPETVDVSWVNEVEVTEYLITYMPTAPGGLELDMRVPGEKRTATIRELEPGVEYLINVYAVLNNKMSVPVSARIATRLPEPEGLKFKAVRESSVEVQWDPLNIAFDGWNLIFRNTKEENGEILNSLSPPETTFEQSGLGPGQEYEVKLEVLKNKTHGPPASKNVVTRIDAPSQVNVRDVTDTTALITWFQPVAQVDGLSVSYGPITGSLDSRAVELSSADTQYHLSELYPDTEYTVSLMARRGEMTSVPVYETFTTDLDAPTNLQVVEETDKTITLEWRNSQANVPSYRIKYGPLSGGEHGELTFPTGPEENTQVQITGLRPGTEYGLGVTAIKDEKESLPATTNAVTELDTPKGLEVTETTETSLMLAWKRPLAKIDVYRLVFVSADGHKTELEVPGSANTHVLRNLNPGMVYTITLTSERGRKKSAPATISGSTDNEKPQVGNITISSISWDGFNISWEPKSEQFEGFVIEVADPDGLTEGQNHTLSGQERSLAVSGLSPHTFYRVTLYSLYRGDLLDPVFAEAITGLGTPKGIHFSDVTDTSVNVHWIVPSYHIDSYRVVYVPLHGGSPMTVTVDGEESKAVLTNLTPAVTYQVTVIAVKGAEESEPASDKVTTGLSTPKGIHFTDVTDTSAIVHWTRPSYPIDSYRVIYVPIHGGSHMTNTVDGEESRAVLVNLIPGMTYLVTVVAVKGAEESEPASDQVTTGLSAPKGIHFTDVTDTSAIVHWIVPSYPIDSYRVSYVPIQGGSHMTVTVDGGESKTVLVNLTPGLMYQVTVIAVKGAEESEPVSDKVTTGLGTPKGIRFSDVTDTSATVHWIVPSYHIDSYRVVYIPVHGGSPLTVTVDGGESKTVLVNLTPGLMYQVTVIAVKGAEESEPVSDKFTTGLGTPKGIRFSDVTDTSATVHWIVPSYHIDSYRVVYVPVHGGSPLTVTVDGGESKTVLVNLTPGLMYQVTVIAVKGVEESEPVSDKVTTGLGTPKGIRFSDVTDTSATVHWIVPSYHIDSYRVVYVPVHGGSPLTVTVDGGESKTVLVNLTPGLMYQVTVIAVKGAEESEPVSDKVTTGLGTPKGIRFSDVTDTSATVHWIVPSYHIDSYRVVYVPVHGGSPLTVTVDGGESKTVLVNLTPGLMYQVTVIAVKGVEESEPVSDKFTTGLGTPKGIRFSDVTDTSATVHWTVPHYHVDSYRITCVPIHGGNPLTVTADGGESKALLAYLTPGVTYEVTVIAVKGAEESEPSSDKVTTALDKPQGLTAVNITDTEALLLWQPTIATVDGYVITYSAESVPPVMERVSGNIVEFEMNSLIPATEYNVKVYAVRDSAKSAATSTQFTTDVDAPQDLAASNIQTESAMLTWKAPRAEITGYILTYESADGTVREVVLSPTSTSYSMSQLSASTEYTVRLQAISGPKRSHPISTVFSTIGVLYRHPKDCSQALLNGDTTSGLYTIYLRGDESQPLQVYCDMTTDGGGWLVFVRRQSGKVDFFRNWRNYTAGFGDMNDEFWLGLTNLHKITSLGQYELRVDLKDKEESAFAQYDKFSVSEPRSRYKVHVGGYSGTAGDSMTYHNGRPFSTYDNDNDIAVTNCALSYKGAFWYKNCHRVNIMGRYGDNSHSKGVNWFHWKGHEHSIQFAEMKIRPSNFRNFEGRRKRS